MLKSMTGQGQAQHETTLGSFAVEVRVVNNRGFKISQRLGDALGPFEPQVESLVRGVIRRGSVQLHAVWRSDQAASNHRIDEVVLAAYYRQICQVQQRLGATSPVDISRLTNLPGVVVESMAVDDNDEEVWQALSSTIAAALENLEEMRVAEGAAMEDQLKSDLALLEQATGEIQDRAPGVVESYRDRLRSRIEAALRREGITLEPIDILKEVQIYADRSDISEELTRLKSHFQLFVAGMDESPGSGRKLDFVIQEMFRETNTIGSKAMDAEIAKCVVEMKCALERMRELVQNVE
jgi:uncharacterized protein (TIGR00255 family)